jgi:hypothetical protein
MAIIKKYPETLYPNLTTYNTFVVDTNPNSTYFRITEFKESFTGGKNGFLIEGSEHLKETTEIKIEILDVDGNPIYWEPGNGIPEYYEGLSKVVAVYIYEDTPIGEAKITVLGELKTYIDSDGVVRDVPDEWKSVYNLKWERAFKVNRLLLNEDKVRFYKRPDVRIDELVKPLFSAATPVVIQTGSVDGTAIAPQSQQKLTNYTLPTFYRLTINDNANWTGSIVGTRLSFPELNWNPLVEQVITNKELFVSDPYTIDGYVENLDNVGYTASFADTSNTSNLKTALTGSFAKITISNLETFVGDVVSVDIYRKSLSKIGDYEFVQKVILESNEILKDYDTKEKNEEVYGILSADVLKNYWVTSSNALTSQFNQNYLYNSSKLDASGTKNYFHTTQSFSLVEGGEYSLNFNTRKLNTGGELRVFISGSKETTFNGNLTTAQVEQNIITVDGTSNSYLQKTLITKNFKADNISNAKLYFEVTGNDWYVADISLKSSQESSFSPNEVTFVQSVPRSLIAETFQYLFKFYDVNGNLIPISIDENQLSKTFDGGNIQRIEKKLDLNPSSLYFQFDSGSQPVPPTVIAFNIEKTLLTGSVNFTSSSIDFFGNVLSASQYVGGVFPGTLDFTNPSIPFLTVANFTGSRDDIDVQLITFTGECEGVTDSVTITAVLDGFGGVNHIIRPYRGTQIRNSSTQSLEVQAVRIDGINDIELYSGSRPERNWNLIQLHILSSSGDTEKFVNLEYAANSGYVNGLSAGELGTKEINYNAIFNRDSIDKRRIVYLINSASAASDFAYNVSQSVLASINLEDLQDGLDTPVITYNADTFTIKYRDEFEFRPLSASVTASFYLRGTNEAPISSSIEVYPSMSINKDFIPEYWMYYVTKSNTWNPDISIVAVDEIGREIKSTPYNQFIGLPLSQSKVLTTTFTYTEPYTLTQISVDKTFTIVPEGKPGDESIVFEIVPASVTLNANAKGIISTYTPANTEVKLKQGAKYLSFTASKEAGTFWLNHVTQSMILTGSVLLSKNYTASLIMSGANNMTELSASLTYDLLIHPYYTSSKYTQSLVQNFTKAVDGAPPIEILLEPGNVILQATETGFVKSYAPSNTSIVLKEGAEYLIYTASQQRGTWYYQSISGSNIQTQSLVLPAAGVSTPIGPVTFNNFLPPAISASAFYSIKAYPYSLLPGHRTGSVDLFTTQSFTKNSDAIKARTVKLAVSTNTVTFDKDGVLITPTDSINFEATPINFSSSINETRYQFFKYDPDTLTYGAYSAITPYSAEGNKLTIYPDEATSPGESAVWRVEMRDGNGDIVRAIDEVTIFGVKDGADSFTSKLTNDNCSIQANIWDVTFTGTGTDVKAFKAGNDLTHISGTGYNPATMVQNIKYENIGYLGYYSASIHSKSSYITLAAANRLTGNPATIANITGWTTPGVNTSAQIVYKVDFEGARAAQFMTQSINVQIEGVGSYNAFLSNEACSLTYKVSGQITFNGTGTTISATRGNNVLTGSTSFSSPQTTIFGTTGYKNQYTVKVYSKSSHLSLAGGLLPGGFVPIVNNVATLPDITDWAYPETYSTGLVVYEIDCEGLAKLYKTQSFSLSYEGQVGPGIVFRGPWTGSIDYIGAVETTNKRRDAVNYNPYSSTLRYYAAVSGSGPSTVGAQQPSGLETDTDYWQYLGDEEFFVAAKIAIFEESYIKNTLNIGTKDTTGAFANIVLAGGRNDPYMAMGQSGTIGLSGDQVTTGVIGYDKPGIFLGIYENPVPNGTTGRFSIRNNDGSKALKWDGSNLYIVGGVRQTTPGVNEPMLKGAWASATEYFNNDVVSYTGASWICTSPFSHVSTNSSNATTGYPGAGPWGTYIQSGSNGATGPGVVYRGEWDSAIAYIFQTGVRRDVVRYSGNYYVAKLNSTNQLPTAPSSVYWESFGAQFSSVATDILLAQDATITRGLVMGVEGGNNGFIRSANATSLTTGSLPGFYMQTDGQFRLGHNPEDVHFPVGEKPPYLRWDNQTLTIRGKIETDDNFTSKIGDWEVLDGNFQHNSGQIILDAELKQIKISDDGNVPRVFMKQGAITVPATATSVNIQAQDSYDFGNPFSPYIIPDGGSINLVQETLDTMGVSVTTPGTYAITTPNFGSDAITVETDANMSSGYVSAYVVIEGWDNPIRSGSNFLHYTLAYGASVYGASQTASSFNNTSTFTVSFPTAGTYYFHTITYLYGFVPSGAGAIVYGQITPNQISPALSLEQTEIGRDGLIVLTNQNNYASIKRTTSAPIVDIKTNGGALTPGIRIENTAGGADVRAIEVLDGDIYCSGVGNNIRVNLGWIGTDYTTDGIRMGTDGNKSILILQDPPAYNPIGGDAGRLRPNQTALGITGYRLTYDSSTRRYKTEIEEYPSSAYDSIKKLKPILFVPKDGENMEGSGSYDYTNTFSFENPREYMGKMPGFLAEDLDEHPELRKFLNYEQEETPVPRSVHYDRLTVLLTKAVQTLMEKVENLEAYISSSKI